MSADVMANARTAVEAAARSARRPKAEPKLKAYIARSYDGESDVIVFAHRNDMAARREAASMMASGDITDVVSLTREPSFDDLAGSSRITAQDYIERGWWFGCAGCERRVSEDMTDYPEDDDEEGADGRLRDSSGDILEPSYHVLHPGSVWCSASCRDHDRERRFREKVERGDEWEKWTAAALRRWPGITAVSVHRRHWDKPETVEVIFDVPGFGKYHHATWEPLVPGERLSCPRVELPAWYAYEASLLHAQDRDPGDEHRMGRLDR